jgi:hypothetical protein
LNGTSHIFAAPDRYWEVKETSHYTSNAKSQMFALIQKDLE